MTEDNSQVGNCKDESSQAPAKEKSLNATQPSSMPSSDTPGQGGASKQDEVPANMLPSVSAAMAKPEAFGAAFEVAFAFAFGVGAGSKVTALTGAPELAFGSEADGAAGEVAFSTAGG